MNKQIIEEAIKRLSERFPSFGGMHGTHIEEFFIQELQTTITSTRESMVEAVSKEIQQLQLNNWFVEDGRKLSDYEQGAYAVFDEIGKLLSTLNHS